MRDSKDLKQIAKGYLRETYWASLIVVTIAYFENLTHFLSNLFQVISGSRAFFFYRYRSELSIDVFDRMPQGRVLPTLSFNITSLQSINWFWLLYGLIAPVLIIGCSSYFLKLLRGQDTEIKGVFDYFSLFFRAIGLSLLMSLIIGLCFFAFFFVGKILVWVFRFGQTFTLIWGIISVIPAVVVSLSYSMSFLVLADNPDLTAIEVLKESRRTMDGERSRFFVLVLSFLGWVILDAFLGGLVMFWVYPYITATVTAFYLDVTNPAQLSAA
ncbi:MAG: DUF975 family protein [Firmicutes bacterium]|nr:DUF975 family protein [Bacillota bacterium]MDD4694412.1 DUF975 family protein [Bacillota bacterium]